MEYALKLNDIVTGFSVNEKYIYCLSGTRVIKAEKFRGGIVGEKEIFKKRRLGEGAYFS